MAAITFGDRLTDEQTEALRDGVVPEQAAGHADWRGGATYIYSVEQDISPDGVDIPKGVYLRELTGNRAAAWRVLAGNVTAYVEAREAEYLAESDGR